MSDIEQDTMERAEAGIPLEEAPSKTATPDEKPEVRSRRKLHIGIGILVIILLAVIGLTVGLVVQSNDRNGNSNESNANSNESSSQQDDNDGDRDLDTPTEGPTDPPTTLPELETAYYTSTKGIFNVTLPLFSASVIRGYTQQEELVQDLTEAMKFVVNRHVEQILRYPTPFNDGYDGDVEVLQPEGEDVMVSAPVDSPTSAEGVDDFETNNQEEGVDEGDLLKTNGDYAFAAYGDYVVVWDAKTGEYITNVTLPAIEFNYDDPPIDVYYGAVASEGFGGRKKRGLQIADMPYFIGPIKPNVQSLLLHGDKLVVVVSGYGDQLREELGYIPTLYDALSTNIRVYDISALNTTSEVTFVKETNVNGYFSSARAIGSDVHLVTFSGLNTWPYLLEPLSRYQPDFQNLTDDEYLEAARKLAEDELIPKFVDGLIRDLSLNGDLISNLARVSIWESELSEGDGDLETAIFSDGVINALAQVTSFDMSETSNNLEVSLSGAFMPTGWGETYATKEMLIVAGQGWNWIDELNGSAETTYLLGFNLTGPLAAPSAVGSMPGYLLNKFAIDIVDGYMRVATTIRNVWPVFELGADIPFAVPSTQNYIVVLEIPQTNSSDPSSLKEVGRTENLGKDGEVIMSVRFSNKVAYAVTFERTDPFYVIGFDDPEQPEVLGELNITGFSSYLHFINDAETLLLGVGQEADTDGRIQGLQVTLYDATDRTNPKALHRHTVEKDENTYSSSTAEWDDKAFRYVPLGDDYGILIIPMRIDSYYSTEGNFDGFKVYDISTDGISERFEISHVDSELFRLGCWYWAQLAERSFVIDGWLTTMKEHSVRLHNLDTFESKGGFSLEVAQEDVCYYW